MSMMGGYQRGGGDAGGGVGERLEKLEGWVKLHVAKAKVVASSASEVTFELGLPDAQAAQGASSHGPDHGHCGAADHGRDRESEEEGSGGGGAEGEGVGGRGGVEGEGRGGVDGGGGGGGGGRGCGESKSKLAVSKCSKVLSIYGDFIYEMYQVTDLRMVYRRCCGGSTPP
jgi:hypothetical protein